MSDQWERVNEVFHLALEHPPGERAVFVSERAGGDQALGDEVLSLLDAHDRAGAFLEEPPVCARDLLDGIGVGEAGRPARQSGPGDVPAAASPPARDGECIGAYRIERELGRGGMGVVFLAEDTRLGRKVALKALAGTHAADERRRERLRTEARAAARLSHPGIATVFALEEIEGELFMASEYVPGHTLRAELDRGLMPVSRLVDVAAQVADALSAAHAAGVVHRDLKPENLVCEDTGPSVKILDFGVARAFSREAGLDEHRLTEAGTIIGTPAYMSPEQFQSADVDYRSDQFSFGVLLYEMATGMHPFEGPSHAATVARIVSEAPRPVSDFGRPLPAAFEQVVDRCLAKRPEDRYASTADLARQLKGLREGLRSPAPGEPARTARRQTPGPQPEHGARWWRVHQIAVVAVYAVMTVIAWLACEEVAAEWSRAVFFAGVAAAATNGTLRVHLLFTQHHNPPAFPGELQRATPWLRGSDILVALVLVALGVAVGRGDTPLAVLLAAVGAGVIVTSAAVEPPTTEAAFTRRRRKLP